MIEKRKSFVSDNQFNFIYTAYEFYDDKISAFTVIT